MTDKQIIIDDQKKTIHRLQQECTEKTDIIVTLNDKLLRKEEECKRVYQLYESIKRCNENNMQTLNEAIKKKDEAENKLRRVEKQYKCYSCGTCNGKEDYYNLRGHHESAIKSLHKQYKKLDQLKAENNTLKEKLAEISAQSALLPKFFGLSAEEITQLTTKCSQLKQALTEIKEIATLDKTSFRYAGSTLAICDDILLKVSEVLDEE